MDAGTYTGGAGAPSPPGAPRRSVQGNGLFPVGLALPASVCAPGCPLRARFICSDQAVAGRRSSLTTHYIALPLHLSLYRHMDPTHDSLKSPENYPPPRNARRTNYQELQTNFGRWLIVSSEAEIAAEVVNAAAKVAAEVVESSTRVAAEVVAVAAQVAAAQVAAQVAAAQVAAAQAVADEVKKAIARLENRTATVSVEVAESKLAEATIAAARSKNVSEEAAKRILATAAEVAAANVAVAAKVAAEVVAVAARVAELKAKLQEQRD